jgi:quinohemoprotein ethanol dehydrogenase
VLTGLGMAYPKNLGALGGPDIEQWGLDPRSQARRVLTFVIGGKATLPPRPIIPPPPADPTFKLDQARFMPGAMAFTRHCGDCHGSMAVGVIQAPDLRRSPIPQDRAAFLETVRSGALQAQGMPRFGELDDKTLDDIRYYIRAQAAQLRGQAAKQDESGVSLNLK